MGEERDGEREESERDNDTWTAHTAAKPAERSEMKLSPTTHRHRQEGPLFAAADTCSGPKSLHPVSEASHFGRLCRRNLVSLTFMCGPICRLHDDRKAVQCGLSRRNVFGKIMERDISCSS